jgi:hypothetical protein
LKLYYHRLLSTIAFNFDMWRCTKAGSQREGEPLGHRQVAGPGGAVQVQTRVESAWFQRLILYYDDLLPSFAFNYHDI